MKCEPYERRRKKEIIIISLIFWGGFVSIGVTIRTHQECLLYARFLPKGPSSGSKDKMLTIPPLGATSEHPARKLPHNYQGAL